MLTQNRIRALATKFRVGFQKNGIQKPKLIRFTGTMENIVKQMDSARKLC